MLKAVYTALEIIFSVSILFLMIALEFDTIYSKFCMTLFRISTISFSWILLLPKILNTAFDTLFLVSVLFSRIALDPDVRCNMSCIKLFLVSATLFTWMMLFVTEYPFLKTSFPLRMLLVIRTFELRLMCKIDPTVLL